MIISPLIFFCGVLFNLYFACYCLRCSRWRSPNNMKYFVIFQTIVNTGNLALHLVLYLRDELNSESAVTRIENHAICDILPNIMACFMSLSVFNLTALVVLRYLKQERRWSFSALKIIITFLGVLISTGLLLSPALIHLYHKMPVLKCNGCYCPSPRVIWEPDIDVWLYGYMVIIFQFVIPAIILSTAALRTLARYLEETRPFSGGCRPCGLKTFNLVILATLLAVAFGLHARGIRFVAGEDFFTTGVSFVEIELLNSVFYHLEVFWAGVSVMLPVCLKMYTDDEMDGNKQKKLNVTGELSTAFQLSSSAKTYCETFVDLELWD